VEEVWAWPVSKQVWANGIRNAVSLGTNV